MIVKRFSLWFISSVTDLKVHVTLQLNEFPLYCSRTDQQRLSLAERPLNQTLRFDLIWCDRKTIRWSLLAFPPPHQWANRQYCELSVIVIRWRGQCGSMLSSVTLLYRWSFSLHQTEHLSCRRTFSLFKLSPHKLLQSACSDGNNKWYVLIRLGCKLLITIWEYGLFKCRDENMNEKLSMSVNLQLPAQHKM